MLQNNEKTAEVLKAEKIGKRLILGWMVNFTPAPYNCK